MLEYLLTWTDDLLGGVHLSAAFIALASGAVILLLPKGRGLHKPLGYLYAAAMLTVNGSALLIYDLTGAANLFHVATLAAGGIAALRYRRTRRPGAIAAHGAFMIWSVYGLVVAAIAEVFTRAVPYMLHGEGGWLRFVLALGVFMAVTGFFTARWISQEIAKTVGSR